MLARLFAALLLLIAVSASSANAWLAQGGNATPPPAGPFVLKCHAAVGRPGFTPDVDCTGANRCYVVLGRYTGAGSLVAPVDTSSNTYVQVGTEATSGTSGASIWKVSGNASVSGTFHWGGGVGFSDFSTLFGACFSDGSTEATDQISQANTANSPGLITPTVDNTLIITGYADISTSGSIGGPSGFTAYTINYTGGTNIGGGMAYQIQTTATARNPAWTPGDGSSNGAAIQASFK